MLTLIRASKHTGQLFSVQLATYTYKEIVSCYPAVNTPSLSNQSFVRYVHFYILSLLIHHLPFSITIELFSKTSFTLLDSHTENAVDLLICPREKRYSLLPQKTVSTPLPFVQKIQPTTYQTQDYAYPADTKVTAARSIQKLTSLLV